MTPKFGYPCQECGTGTVQPISFRKYRTKFEDEVFTAPEAFIGVCDKREARHYSAQEYKRWRRLFQEGRESKVSTRVTLPASLHRKLQGLKQKQRRSQSEIVAELIRQV